MNEIVARELLALEQKVRAACVREEFKAALVLVEDARKKALSSEWSGEMDGKAREVQSRADTAFSLVKEQALRAKPDELRALKERVAKWGLERFDVEEALAKAAPKAEPPPPPIRPGLETAEPAAKPPPAPPNPPSPPAAPRRPAVPDAAKQRDAEAAVKKAFNLDQAKTSKEKADLARTLLQSAVTSGAKAAELYVLLRTARDLAVQGMNVKMALEAIDARAAAFDVDALSEKVDLFAKASVKGTDAEAWAGAALDVAEQASERDDYEMAVKLAGRAEALARAANDKGLQETAKERGKELADLKRVADGLKGHFMILETKPDDLAANAAVGKFVSLVKGDWKRGPPMLAKGSDSALKNLAEQELANPTDAAAQAALGEAWAAQAEKETPTYKPRARDRAVEWLGRAIPGLTGLAKVSAERKLASLGPTTGPKSRQ
ncbi:MAG TPA: hypothetical protein VG457_05890, partial [Planctomycetota bacterium]|nr:hypothetical protein [Planctomycetota bacterium]